MIFGNGGLLEREENFLIKSKADKHLLQTSSKNGLGAVSVMQTALMRKVIPASFFSPRFEKVRLTHYLDLSVQFSSVAQLYPTLCNPMDCSMPGLPVHHQLLEFTQTHVPWIGDAIQPSHPLSSPSPSAFNLSQHQDLFKWVSSSHQVGKVLELQLQHQSFQWIFRTDFL